MTIMTPVEPDGKIRGGSIADADGIPAEPSGVGGRSTMVTIYALVDPRDGTPRYIGRTARPHARLKGHWTALERAYRYGQSPAHRWLHELKVAGLVPIFTVLDVVNRDEADRMEGHHIRAHLARGCKLTNRRAGHFQEETAKVSACVLARTYNRLAAEAEERQCSLSWLVRDILEQHVEHARLGNEGVA